MHSNKPIIGITLSEAEAVNSVRWPLRGGFDYLKRQYYEAVLKAGGIPVLLPNVEDTLAVETFIELVQGLLVTGGPDIHPSYFGQKPHQKLTRTTVARDRFELLAIKLGLKKRIPILGICRGFQVLNVSFGGTLYQDLTCIPGRVIRHADPKQTGRVFHKVRITEGSQLHHIIDRLSIEVNSSHHQAIDTVGKGLSATAFSADGVIEGIERPASDFVIGVQWHPEGINRRTHSKRLLSAFVTQAASKS
jgi:putative glutamine amidotransferase